MNKMRGYTLVELVWCVVVLLAASGWVWNIVKVAESDFSTLTGVLVLRVVGIFVPPLGAVMGWL